MTKKHMKNIFPKKLPKKYILVFYKKSRLRGAKRLIDAKENHWNEYLMT